MKIAVCVKEVPDATAHKRIDPGTKRLDRSGEGALNAFDANAVEEALRLKDATGEGEVVLASVGPGAGPGDGPGRGAPAGRSAPAANRLQDPAWWRRAMHLRRRSSARART